MPFLYKLCTCEYKLLFIRHFSCFIYSCLVLVWFPVEIALLSYAMSYSSVRFQWVQLFWTVWRDSFFPLWSYTRISSHLDGFGFVSMHVVLCSEVIIFKCYFCTKVLELAGTVLWTWCAHEILFSDKVLSICMFPPWSPSFSCLLEVEYAQLCLRPGSQNMKIFWCMLQGKLGSPLWQWQTAKNKYLV